MLILDDGFVTLRLVPLITPPDVLNIFTKPNAKKGIDVVRIEFRTSFTFKNIEPLQSKEPTTTLKSPTIFHWPFDKAEELIPFLQKNIHHLSIEVKETDHTKLWWWKVTRGEETCTLNLFKGKENKLMIQGKIGRLFSDIANQLAVSPRPTF